MFYGGTRFGNPDDAIQVVAAEEWVDETLDTGIALDYFGQSVAGVGDVTGDGLGDFAIGVRGADPDKLGAVHVYDSSLLAEDRTSDSRLDGSGGGAASNTGAYALTPLEFFKSDVGEADSASDLVITYLDDPGQMFKNSTPSNAAGKPLLEEDTAEAFGAVVPESNSRGTAVGDFNNDGVLDVFVASKTAPKLYAGRASGAEGFDEVMPSTMLSLVTSSIAAAWGDYDRDGKLDLYVVRAEGAASDQSDFRGTPLSDPSYYVAKQDRLFRGDGNGNFEDVTAAVGLSTEETYSSAAAWCDVDMDGHLDLYVSAWSDGASGEYGILYRNKGDGTFEDRSGETTPPAIGPMWGVSSIAFADLDRDQDFDLILSRGDVTTANLSTCRNDGSGVFSAENIWFDDVSTHVAGFAVADFDLNGFVDVVAASKEATADAHAMFGYADGADVRFVDRGSRVGVPSAANYSASSADLDGDGDHDLTLASENVADRLLVGSPNQLNSAPTADWIGIRLSDQHGFNTRDGIGAIVTLSAYRGTEMQFTTVKQVSSASLAGGGNQLISTFGLGYGIDEVEVTVDWPEGCQQSVEYAHAETDPNLQLNGVRTIEHPEHPDVGFIASTFDSYILLQPNLNLTLVVEWVTECRLDDDSLSAEIEPGSKNAQTCWDPPTILDSSNSVIEISSLPSGRYLNRITNSNIPCTAPCKYTIKQPAGEFGGDSESWSATTPVSVLYCVW